jgi:uncharacterized alpha-E superfamily protein
MLSRVADALYWMSRYMERAEHAARVLEQSRTLLIDIVEVDRAAAEQHWRDTLLALALSAELAQLDVAFSRDEAGSIALCLERARENARAVREVISSEMWEYLNQAYWSLNEASQSPTREEQLGTTLAQVIASGFLWSGVTDGTMRRGEGWLFIKLGQFAERADRVSRLVSVRSRAAAEGVGTASLAGGENVLWPTLLKSCSGFEAYRKVHPARVDPKRVVEFLLLDQDFPRSVRYSTTKAADYARRLGGDGADRSRQVEHAFGKLAARLQYTSLDEVLQAGVVATLDGVLGDLSGASLALQRTYFLH